jgi:hypothetical protein
MEHRYIFILFNIQNRNDGYMLPKTALYGTNIIANITSSRYRLRNGYNHEL